MALDDTMTMMRPGGEEQSQNSSQMLGLYSRVLCECGGYNYNITW